MKFNAQTGKTLPFHPMAQIPEAVNAKSEVWKELSDHL